MPSTELNAATPQLLAATNTSVAGDAHEIRALIREAEAVSDDLIQTCSRLKIAMLNARRNPAVGVAAGQAALMRLTNAESQALELSTSLLRVHESLSSVARETAGTDDGQPTNIPASALAPQ